MIVIYGEKGWEVITQRSHGIVAAQLGFQWKAKDRPTKWVETVLAIAEHDDAENELDGENLVTEAGGPLHFAMKRFELPHVQKLSQLTITKSRYIALLTSLHMTFLYEKDKGSIKGAGTFLEEQEKLQEKWRKELGLSKEEVLRAYDLLEWCDALSLLICKGEMQPEHRAMEISTGPDKKIYRLFQVDETSLSVEPWPFETDQFSVNFEVRTIGTIQFSSSEAFRKAFLQAPVREQTWKLSRQKKIRKGKVKVG